MKQRMIAEFIHKEELEDDTTLLMFKVDNHQYRQVCESLTDGQYALEIGKVRNKRTQTQNKYFWAMVHEIAEREDGHLKNEVELYATLLEMASAKYEYIRVLDTAVESLRTSTGIRALKVVRRVQENGHTFADCKLYLGSSNFDTKEMGALIDVTLDYAERVGINTYFYREMLK